jgi:hypothetical protein
VQKRNGPEISAMNAKEFGYEVRVDVPDEGEPEFRRLYLKFPEFLGEFVTPIHPSSIRRMGSESFLIVPMHIQPCHLQIARRCTSSPHRMPCLA